MDGGNAKLLIPVVPKSYQHSTGVRRRKTLHFSSTIYTNLVTNTSRKKISLLKAFFVLWLAPASRRRGLGCGDYEEKTDSKWQISAKSVRMSRPTGVSYQPPPCFLAEARRPV
jgi:hypothetical protein